MNLNLKKLLGFALLAATGLVSADCTSYTGTSCGDTALTVTIPDDLDCTPKTVNNLAYGQMFFSQRPQHSNTARDEMGTAGRIHQFAQQEFNGDVSVGLSFEQTTNSNQLGSWFFFNGTNTMTYGPNWTAGSNTNNLDVNGLNFAVTASGTITATPRIQNLVADFQLYLGWDEFVQGLWTRICVPVNWVRTDMRLVDSVTNTGVTTYYQGDVSNATGTAVVYPNLATAWVGNKAAGDFAGRATANINGRRDKVGVSGLVFELGYDLLRRESGHFGLALRAVAPTGTEPNAVYLFEPISGANGCWEIGGGITGSYELYNNNDNHRLNFFIDGNVTHLGAHAQKRTLGLQNIRAGGTGTTVAGANYASVGSSWILLKQMTSAGVYNGVLKSASDLTSLVVKIGNAAMADLSLSLKYYWGNYAVAAGYNFFGRTKEEASAREASAFANATTNVYVIKDTSTGTPSGNASLLTGTDTTAATKATSDITRSGATVGNVSGGGESAVLAQALTDADIAVCPTLQPTTLSNKVFGSVEYNWSDNEWEPYVLLGGTYEIGCTNNGIKNSSVDAWGVLAKGGIAF